MSDDRLLPNERIAKITRTLLGYEDHGILTVWLTLDYGGAGQGAGGYGLDSYDKERKVRVAHPECGRWVAGVIGACGVRNWEDVKGRTVIAIRDNDSDFQGRVIGLRPLPTEGGQQFMFKESA